MLTCDTMICYLNNADVDKYGQLTSSYLKHEETIFLNDIFLKVIVIYIYLQNV